MLGLLGLLAGRFGFLALLEAGLKHVVSHARRQDGSADLSVRVYKNKNLAWKVFQKSTFAEIGFLMIQGSIFHDFGWPWDQFSWLLLPWRPARKLMNFHRDFGVIPDPEPRVGGGRCVAFWGTVNSP